MQPLSDAQLRASLVNCSKGEVRRMYVPGELELVGWTDLDYFGWSDPKAPQRGFLVAETDSGVRGVALRTGNQTGRRRSMCSLCLTTRSGAVSLMVAKRAGKAGQDGNSVGTYICSDFACSLFARGLRATDSIVIQETLSSDERVARLQANVAAFLDRVRR